jgi:ABC-type molybdenum transport system ATPase subunit/photorepair protein PhrA
MKEPSMKIRVSSPIRETPRVLQVRGLFDLPAAKTSVLEWDVALPLTERSWHIGLVVGPSGCGKSTLARHLWPEALAPHFEWPPDAALLDAFPDACSIKEITEILSSVGFSSPPAWLRPFHVLSTGQQFRVVLARLIAQAAAEKSQTGSARLIVCDEFTSVVDRTVAQIGSAAVARTIRDKQLQFVAVTCHEDVEAWLQPDWVYRPAEQAFTWRLLQRRPALPLRLVRCRASAWPLFAPHHYLSARLAPSAVCFLASWDERPVAFSAWLPFFGAGPPARREHRTVCLPDYQGIGIGGVVSATVAAMWKALGYRATSTTTHPGLIRARLRSARWRLTRAPALAGRGDVIAHARTRLTAGFEYVGPPLPLIQAKALLRT